MRDNNHLLKPAFARTNDHARASFKQVTTDTLKAPITSTGDPRLLSSKPSQVAVRHPFSLMLAKGASMLVSSLDEG